MAFRSNGIQSNHIQSNILLLPVRVMVVYMIEHKKVKKKGRGNIMKVEKVKKVPAWAICYIQYGDDSGLEPGDKKLVDDWIDHLLRVEGLRLICPIEGSESEFEPYPAFGGACGTVDYEAEKNSAAEVHK